MWKDGTIRACPLSPVLRRRGFTPESIRNFCDRIGVAKANSIVDIALLEYSIREDLNRRAPRVMGVLRPLKVIIENYPVDQVEDTGSGEQSRRSGHGHS